MQTSVLTFLEMYAEAGGISHHSIYNLLEML